ncbi:MAG: hypothetical protein M3Y04_08160 [Actinomycetota bacterium]|nr:hypothetical protein [Actinomycetota bacterium]
MPQNPSGDEAVRLDVDVAWAEVGGMVTDTDRTVAPRRLAALLDEGDTQ